MVSLLYLPQDTPHLFTHLIYAFLSLEKKITGTLKIQANWNYNFLKNAQEMQKPHLISGFK